MVNFRHGVQNMPKVLLSLKYLLELEHESSVKYNPDCLNFIFSSYFLPFSYCF